MNLSPAVTGFIRSVVYTGIFAAVLAVLSYLSDATHLHGVVNDSLALLIAGIAASIEHKMEDNGKGALFGAVRMRSY